MTVSILVFLLAVRVVMLARGTSTMVSISMFFYELLKLASLCNIRV
jgi:hypothetical protein